MRHHIAPALLVIALLSGCGDADDGPRLSFGEDGPNMEELEASLPDSLRPSFGMAFMTLAFAQDYELTGRCPSLFSSRAHPEAAERAFKAVEGKTARQIIAMAERANEEMTTACR